MHAQLVYQMLAMALIDEHAMNIAHAHSHTRVSLYASVSLLPTCYAHKIKMHSMFPICEQKSF